jgi:hypothetical protein
LIVFPGIRWIMLVLRLRLDPNAPVERMTSPENPTRLVTIILACDATPGATHNMVTLALSLKSGTVAGAAVTVALKLVPAKSPAP